MKSHPIVCIRVGEEPPGEPIRPELTRVPCHDCLIAVWASPSTVKAVASGKFRPVCQVCGWNAVKGTTIVVGMTLGGIEELSRWKRQDAERN